MSILAMNQNVFSSVFVGKKVSREAKRAIEAEMIVPASAIEMTYDEMEYVDGGGFISLIDTKRSGINSTVATLVGLAYCFGVVGMVSGFVSKALLVAPEPTLITKVFGVAIGLYSMIAGYIASSIAYSAIIAADKASRGEHFRFGIETVFLGIPVGVTIQ